MVLYDVLYFEIHGYTLCIDNVVVPFDDLSLLFYETHTTDILCVFFRHDYSFSYFYGFIQRWKWYFRY